MGRSHDERDWRDACGQNEWGRRHPTLFLQLARDYHTWVEHAGLAIPLGVENLTGVVESREDLLTHTSIAEFHCLWREGESVQRGGGWSTTEDGNASVKSVWCGV